MIRTLMTNGTLVTSMHNINCSRGGKEGPTNLAMMTQCWASFGLNVATDNRNAVVEPFISQCESYTMYKCS